MWTVAKRFGSTLKDESGLVLLVVVTLAVIILISGLAFLTLTGSGSAMLTGPMNEGKALHLAEGRMRKAIWRMNQRPLNQWSVAATFSDTTADGVATCAYDSATSMLTCTGVVGSASKAISVEINIEYAGGGGTLDHIILYKNFFTELGAAGTLVHDADSGPLQVSDLPAIDLGYYMGIADVTYTGDQSFQSTTLTGIHYVAGNVRIKNNTVINGAIVTTGNLRFQGQNTLNAHTVPGDSSTYYPAVIVKGNISGGNQNLYINGAVYCDGTADFNPCHITGMIVAAGVELQGSYTVTHDPIYSVPPPGFIWPPSYNLSVGGGTPVATMGSWSEN